MPIKKNTFFINHHRQINDIPDDCTILIIKCKIVNLDFIPLNIQKIYFLDNRYLFNYELEEYDILCDKEHIEENENRKGSYFDFIDEKCVFDKKTLPKSYINIYAFYVHSSYIQVKLKIPFGCELFNNDMEKITNFENLYWKIA